VVTVDGGSVRTADAQVRLMIDTLRANG